MKERSLKFYVNKFNYLDSADDLDLSFVPSIVRRRMSLLDKLALSTINAVYTDDIEYIVFSSQFGQVDRLLKIISQHNECNEVSPNTFSGSVHNYSASFFLLNQKISIPYTSLCSSDESVSTGLLVSVISNYDNVLYCYGDVNNGVCNSLAINITKNNLSKGAKYCLKLENNAGVKDKFKNFADLFEGKSACLKTSKYLIERIIHD